MLDLILLTALAQLPPLPIPVPDYCPPPPPLCPPPVAYYPPPQPPSVSYYPQPQPPSVSYYPPPQPQPVQRDDVVLLFNRVALDTIRAEKSPPPLAARNLAIMHIAMYDAVNAIERTHRPYLVQASPPAGTCRRAAAAVAAHRTLVALYPRQTERFDQVLHAFLESLTEADTRWRGIELGKHAADTVLAWRARDGVAAQVAYQPGREPGEWQPTPPEFKPPLFPQWPQLTPFAMRSGSQFRPAGPPALLTEAYARAFNEVKSVGSVNSPTRTRDQTEIAWFWRDDAGTCTPPGHWNMIAQEVARAQGTTLADNARLFALLNVALADGAIACWDAKYHFRFWRPVTGIRRADEVNNPFTAADRDWTPLLVTPPFPSYTSGHSTFSGAGAAMLARFFGADRVNFTVGSDELRDARRSFNGFWHAAEEAGRSRIYGGIHWEFDNAEGLTCGREVADYVFKNFMTPLPREQSALPTPYEAARRSR